MHFVLSKLQPLSRPQPVCLAAPDDTIIIPELLMLIFDCLVPEDLASAALVCRAWSMASKKLWSTHEVPLSALLAKTGFLATKEADAPDEMRHYSISPGSLEPIVWMTLIHQYSHIITRLRIDSVIEESALDILRQVLDLYGDSLFPRLYSVTFDMSAIADVQWETIGVVASMLKTLLNSSLMDVKFEGHEDDTRVMDICHSLPDLCPQITDLTLGTPQNIDASYFRFRCHGFSNLKRLMICDWKWEGWEGLGAPSGLEEIIITDSGVSDTEDFVLKPVTILPSLRSLTISLATLCRAALLEAEMPALRSLTIAELMETTGEVIEAISKRSPSLEHLDIRFARARVTLRMTEALSALHGLRTLRLGGWASSVILIDSDITPLARSLIHLENLSVIFDAAGSGRSPAPRIPKLTGSSFVAILHHCNALKELELQLDLSTFSLEEARSAAPVTPSETLTRLTLSRFTILPSEGLSRLAQDLAICCPKVPQLKIRETPDGIMSSERGMELVDEFYTYRQLSRPLSS
ncbi:hypothetical protein FRB94_000600 [Tulasnella sp. JGI-2019a]|nr:hypothetical protein FRB93_013717 [Tulasnella sp. JGI-2019a]KAG9006583.1 hypothetical protein FRB94_000600 [Tulasnella sp. JGI-2019a]